MPDLYAAIVSEIQAGFRNEAARLDDALFNYEFYSGDFSRFPPKPAGDSYEPCSPRVSVVMQRVVKVLTANLYAKGPGRTLKAPDSAPDSAYDAASEWLEAVYRANAIDALFQEADRMATVGDFCGFQAVGTRDPKRPVRVQLWKANELLVWLDPDDQLRPVAVGTLDLYNEQRRLRLWTVETVTTFMTKQWNRNAPNGATAFYQVGAPAEHGYGVLPFAFVHFEFPTSVFMTNGPGTILRKVNESVNNSLSDTGDGVKYNLIPVVVLKNVRAGWSPPKPHRPGTVWELPADVEGEGEAKQDASLLQADSAFVAASWDDVLAYIDHSLEMFGVPAVAYRLNQSSVASGAAQLAEQAPLALWARSRQRPFGYYEDALARVVLAVGGNHLAMQDFDEYRATAGQLLLVADEPGLVLRWPSMYTRIPGPETDQGDQWLLDNKLVSRTHLIMERDGLTHEEAEAYLEEIAEDLEREKELFGLEPVALPDGTVPGQPDEPAEVDDPTVETVDPEEGMGGYDE